MKDYKYNFIGRCFIQICFAVTIVPVFLQVCSGQVVEVTPYSQAQKENLLKLTKRENFRLLANKVIKREIASFLVKTSFETKVDSLTKPYLNIIPLENCTDSHVEFSNGEIIVSIDSGIGIPKPKIKNVRFIHVKYVLDLPDSAIAGIYEPNFCTKKNAGKNGLKSNCKVFRSEDRRRVYIYMLNGSGKDQYEVTWIIQDSKYYGRVLDIVPDL